MGGRDASRAPRVDAAEDRRDAGVDGEPHDPARKAGRSEPRGFALEAGRACGVKFLVPIAAHVGRKQAKQQFSQSAVFLPSVEGIAGRPQFVHFVLPGTPRGVSSSHWRRMIDQGGVKLDGEPVGGYDVEPADGAVLQAGKRLFVRIRTG